MLIHVSEVEPDSAIHDPHTQTGEEAFYIFSSGGHSGQVIVIGVPWSPSRRATAMCSLTGFSQVRRSSGRRRSW